MLPSNLTMDQMTFLLALVSGCATLAGIIFAVYGFINLGLVDRKVDKKVAEKSIEIKNELNDKVIRSQEVLQKIIAAYALSANGDHEGAIKLLDSVVTIDPEAFNGYIALGYEYSILGRKQEAIDCFNKAITLFPERPEPYNDLAREYAKCKENRLALKYISETLKRKPGFWKEIEGDKIFDNLRLEYKNKYEEVLKDYKGK